MKQKFRLTNLSCLYSSLYPKKVKEEDQQEGTRIIRHGLETDSQRRKMVGSQTRM